MKKSLIMKLIAGLLAMLAMVTGAKKISARRKKKQLERNEMMKELEKNQKLLTEACDRSDEATKEALRLCEELRRRLDEPDVGVDPNEIDVSLKDETA